MIMDEKFLNKLKDFGLNSYEAKIWTALLSRGVSTAGELSDISNVPRSRSYDVLESLEKKGFIIMKIGKPIKYVAVPPKEVIERVKKRIAHEADVQTKIIDELKENEILAELSLLHTQGVKLVDPTDFTGSLKGRSSINNQLAMMVGSAEKSVVIMTTEEGLPRKAQVLKRSLDKASKRGVNVRILAPITKKNQDFVDKLSKVAEVRHIDNITARFCVVDGKEIAFMLLDDKDVEPGYDTGIWASTEFFAGALQSMFDLNWKEAK